MCSVRCVCTGPKLKHIFQQELVDLFLMKSYLTVSRLRAPPCFTAAASVEVIWSGLMLQVCSWQVGRKAQHQIEVILPCMIHLSNLSLTLLFVLSPRMFFPNLKVWPRGVTTSHFVLDSLHWLSVCFLITFKALHVLAPDYIIDLLIPYEPWRSLRSSGSGLLSVPESRLKTKGDRASAIRALRPRGSGTTCPRK